MSPKRCLLCKSSCRMRHQKPHKARIIATSHKASKKTETHNRLQDMCNYRQPCTVNRDIHTHTHTHRLTWYHTGDLGEEAFDSPDGNTSWFFILYSCNNVFNLWEAQRECVKSHNFITQHIWDNHASRSSSLLMGNTWMKLKVIKP